MTRIPELEAVRQQSYWQATAPAMPDRRGRPLPDAADVVVVGGGLTGLSAARRSAELGASVVLLEGERLGWGGSTRNGGMCHPGYKHSVAELVAEHGEAKGTALYRETVDAYEHVKGLCATSIGADFVEGGHLVLAAVPSHAEAFGASAEALRRVDMPALVVARQDLRSEIGTDAYFGGLVVERSAGLHPGKLVAGLVRLAEDAGASLHEETRALRIRPQADGRKVVETSRGALLAGDVIVATNGYTGSLTPSLRRRLLSIGSFIIVTDPLPADLAAELSPRGRMFFDTKNFLYYWRLTPDNRMLFGGRADGVTYAVGCCGSGVAIMPWLGTRIAEWVGGSTPPELASLTFPLVPAPYEGRAWFLPIAGEYWKAKDRLALREAAKDAAGPGPNAG